ncbi:negative elongation factor E-like [Mya arenaria]|uniref:negative elongation factor E-like n=1 Tax=Mya arenaria TaxID=6604 RepID=UPI0022E6F75A|nr:negative elongation factor E-like [Mya arenaria]
MVYIHFPANLTEEEEMLKLKYARLRKKKKQLQALKTIKPEREPVKEKPVKRPSESAEDAKEQAKKLVMSGAIKLSDKKEKQGFKRSRNFEKKLQDPEKTPQPMVAFTPFAATQGEEREEREERPARPRGAQVRGLYDSFVKGDREPRPDREVGREEREERFRERRPVREREPLPKKGNTVYVHGMGVSEETLRKTFSNFGKIVNVSMEKERNCGFITFENMDSADIAIQEGGGAMVEGIQLKVSMARRQPSFDAATSDQSTTSWAAIAASTSQKGVFKDKRDVVAYEDDMF